MSAPASDAPDRIFVRDFVKEVEIGAFQSERDVTQRIMFNVALDVAPSDAAQSDDVDQILSYDAITDAIEHQLAVERLNLLETLAERIASEILQHARALQVMVRIEKLDRVPGTLGIEIARGKSAAESTNSLQTAKTAPVVVALAHGQDTGAALKGWLDGLAALGRPVVICLDTLPNLPSETGSAVSERRIGLLSIEQNAWVVAADPRCTVVDSRTELDWAVQNGLMSVWAPTKMVMDAFDAPDLSANDHVELAKWLAGQVGAADVLLLGGKAAETGDGLRQIADPDELGDALA